MISKFVPDLWLEKVTDLTPELIKKHNKKAVLLDIDNTLVRWGEEHPTEELFSWFESLVSADISIAFISNNSKERVEVFNSQTKYPAFYKAKKPSAKSYFRLIEQMGLEKADVMCAGDQIFTDVWGAKNAGLMAVYINPVDIKNGFENKWYFKIKRFGEKPFLSHYKKRNGNLI